MAHTHVGYRSHVARSTRRSALRPGEVHAMASTHGTTDHEGKAALSVCGVRWSLRSQSEYVAGDASLGIFPASDCPVTCKRCLAAIAAE